MSQKTERPVLSGQRIKTRKRDEKEKYDPTGFRDAVIAGLEKTGGDLDAISKFLDIAGNKLDYRRYGEVLFDILIAGGLLVPGGFISQDGEKPSTEYCIFRANEDMDTMRSHEQVFIKLMRRFKYLEKMFEEEMKKVLIFIKGFTPSERIKLARMTALWIANGSVPPTVLLMLLNEHLVKDETALDFLLEVCLTFKQEIGLSTLVQTLKKGNIESRLMEFFPAKKQTEECLKSTFMEKDLLEVVKLHKAQASYEAKRELTQTLIDNIGDNKSHKEIITDIKELATKTNIPDHEIVCLIWTTIMGLAEWNKKEELVTDQALKHLKQYTQLLKAFASTDRAELSLILKVQEFCYENMNFMKAFQRIILLFYKANVVSEDAILKWFREGHPQKGKMHFLEQMKKFVEWLQNAEEESESEEED